MADTGSSSSLSFDAVIFDLDGVVTKTAVVHAAAWKEMFDEYLKIRKERSNEPFKEFSQSDYLTYVDGKPRYEGVKSFLESRDINIPFGDSKDDLSQETVCALGNRKNIKFQNVLEKSGVPGRVRGVFTVCSNNGPIDSMFDILSCRLPLGYVSAEIA